MVRSSQQKPPALTLAQKIGLVAALILFAVPLVFTFNGLSVAGHRMLAIFLLAVTLWVTEAVPLHATAVLVILLEILFVSDRSLFPAPEGFTPPAYTLFFNALANPVIMLFLGGFFLADGAARFELDRNLARVLLKPFGTRPSMILLGLMAVTAIFSMFMSNTATTATMMAVVMPIIAQLPAGDRMRAGIALSIPVAANIGGIGTPIGTPPNAIALAAMAKEGMPIGFFTWMKMAMPFMLVILAMSWGILCFFFRASEKRLVLRIEGRFNRSWPAIILYVTFAVTVLLWLTEEIHGIPSAIVGFVPVVVLLCTRVFTTRDLQGISWHVLWLVAGGIALGTGVEKTGLDAWFIGLVGWEALSAWALSAVLCVVALLMSSFISHSATANLLVPIGISLAVSDAVAISPVLAGILIAVGSSLAMAFPISTPPNAIAYSTGAVTTRDMAKTGLLVGVFGWLLFVIFGPWWWRLLGVIQ